jgi:hypothetical protein
MTAYTYHPNTQRPEELSVIVFCQGSFANWNARYSSGNTVGFHHNGMPVATGSAQMDFIWGYLPATFIHELTHARNILGNEILRKYSFVLL